MSSNIAKTLIKVINDQAYRLGIELKKKYSHEQAQFLSKHAIATIYGFDHWCNMIFFINTNENPKAHERFDHVALHPRNIEFTSPEFINLWEDKKILLAKVLRIKPTINAESTFKEKYTGDELSNYLAKMYGFQSMSQVWSNLKFHVNHNDKYYSLFDCKNKELLIQIDFKPESSDFLQEIIINHLSYGKALAVAPKEWFKYEFDCSTIAIAEDYKRRGPFYAWTVKRLTNLFIDETISKFGNFVTINTAKELLQTIIPIMMYDNEKSSFRISMQSFCEILKLKNLLLIIGDSYYPYELQLLAREYIESLGHVFDGTYSTLNSHVQKKHDNGAMLVSHSVFSLSALFETDQFSISDELRLIDVENIGYFSKYVQKSKGVNVSNDIISEISLMGKETMVLLFDSKDSPVDPEYINPIRDFCRLKKMIFTIITDDKSNNFKIDNKLKVEKNGEIIDFILAG